MHYVILAFALAIGVMFAARWFVRLDATRVANVLSKLWQWGMIAIGLVLLMRGSMLIGLPLIAFGIAGLLGIANPLSRMGGQRSSGHRSQVRSRKLEMELDHDSGEVDGTVRSGPFEQRRLSELALDELLELYEECLNETDQSAALLEAFLDRGHAGWREADGASEKARTGGRPDTADTMTREEAYEILGLDRNAKPAEISKAHRRLMKKFHPDLGGSDHLATKINRAKEILLDE